MKNDLRFRYLEKYIGKYRVVARYDLDTNDFPRDEFGNIDESFEDLYIPCSKGKSEIRHTYQKDILCWYTPKPNVGKNVVKALESKKNKINFSYEETPEDFIIYFNEKNLDDIAKIVNPKTTGAKIKPFSNKNLPKVLYDMPEKDSVKLDKLLPDLPGIEKAQLMRQLTKDFDKEIQNKKGKKYDIDLERKKSKLKPKQFIHSIGMWNDFLKFVEKEIK